MLAWNEYVVAPQLTCGSQPVGSRRSATFSVPPGFGAASPGCPADPRRHSRAPRAPRVRTRMTSTSVPKSPVPGQGSLAGGVSASPSGHRACRQGRPGVVVRAGLDREAGARRHALQADVGQERGRRRLDAAGGDGGRPDGDGRERADSPEAAEREAVQHVPGDRTSVNPLTPIPTLTVPERVLPVDEAPVPVLESRRVTRFPSRRPKAKLVRGPEKIVFPATDDPA
jgi:hypothetical protein